MLAPRDLAVRVSRIDLRQVLERDEALAQLAAAAEAGGRVAVVTGEAGIGKTTLVRGFAEGRQVLWGACDDLTVPQPLGPLRDLGVADGPALLRALGICILEDCHWADEATLDALTHVARRIGRSSGLLVLTFRDDELALDHPLRRVVGSIPPQDVVRVPLAPLSREAVQSSPVRPTRTPSTRRRAATRSSSPRRSRAGGRTCATRCWRARRG